MGPEQVTGEWLSKVLGAPVEVVAQSRIGDGLVGMNLRVAVRSDDPGVPDSVVIKLRMWAMLFPGFIATYGKYLSPEATELATRFGGRLAARLERGDSPLTVTHGDYRLDNLMFASPEGGAPITTVDWQCESLIQ